MMIFKRIVCFLLLIFSASLIGADQSADQQRLKWFNRADAQSLLSLDPTLPAPNLLPEKEYTLGTENVLHWNADSMAQVFAGLNLSDVFYEIEAHYLDGDHWGFVVESQVDSAVFKGLPEGIRIDYRLRYFAKTAEGQYAMSYWSGVESSIQDVRPPVLHAWDIRHLQRTSDMNWIVGNTIEVEFTASDSVAGKVAKVILQESGQMPLLYSVLPPALYADSLVTYEILTPAHTLLTLKIWIEDVSGQVSAADSVSFFWWPFEGDEEKMVCFPNPFNPDMGENSIIKIDLPGVTKARVFDLMGNLVATLFKPEENEFFEWDGRNDRGDRVANGGYLCVVDGKERVFTKIAVLR